MNSRQRSALRLIASPPGGGSSKSRTNTDLWDKPRKWLGFWLTPDSRDETSGRQLQGCVARISWAAWKGLHLQAEVAHRWRLSGRSHDAPAWHSSCTRALWGEMEALRARSLL